MKKKTTTKTAPKAKRPVGRPRKNPPVGKSETTKVVLTKSQLEVANKLGLTAQEYIKNIVSAKAAKKAWKIKSKKPDTSFELSRIRELIARIEELEYQNIGFRSVISYLETQLGLTQTQ
jgi:hypothetical protein